MAATSKRPELVCPAGGLPALKAAVDNGADCVYIGLRDDTNIEGLRGLKTVMEGGCITAGNASQLSDGASACVVMNEKLAAEYDISILCSDRDISNKPIYRMKPTRIVVDTTALWHHIDEESIDARIVMIKEQIADNDSKLANYLSTTRITPFARWSSYWQSNNKISNNGDIGVRFTIPIYNENPRKRKALETEKEIIRSSRSTDVKEIKQSVGILLKRIENLNHAIATEAFHIEQTGKYIDMRRFAYKNQKQGYNYLMRMDEYTGFLESMERMYKLMLNRGLAIINIEKAVSIYDNNTIFREIEL